jgi:hypothetical protein
VLSFDNLSAATLPDSVTAGMMDSTIGAVMRLANCMVVSFDAQVASDFRQG